MATPTLQSVDEVLRSLPWNRSSFYHGVEQVSSDKILVFLARPYSGSCTPESDDLFHALAEEGWNVKPIRESDRPHFVVTEGTD